MASWARKASCSAMASAISRCVSIVSSCRAPLVDSTNNGIELLITGISRGTTTFFAAQRDRCMKFNIFLGMVRMFFNNASTSSQSVVIFYIFLLARVAAIAAIEGSSRKRTSRRSWISFCLLPIKVNPSGSSTIPGDDAI